MEYEIRDGLPDPEENGQTATWIFQDRDGQYHRMSGVFLGIGSTHRPEHKGHPLVPWAPQGTHCSTCRWTELRIFRRADGRLAVVRCGVSEVPGERDLITVLTVDSGFELVEMLTTVDRTTRNTILPMPARRALAQASGHDARVRDAYINSPVT
jgi:hypothetical protein